MKVQDYELKAEQEAIQIVTQALINNQAPIKLDYANRVQTKRIGKYYYHVFSNIELKIGERIFKVSRSKHQDFADDMGSTIVELHPNGKVKQYVKLDKKGVPHNPEGLAYLKKDLKGNTVESKFQIDGQEFTLEQFNVYSNLRQHGNFITEQSILSSARDISIYCNHLKVDGRKLNFG